MINNLILFVVVKQLKKTIRLFSDFHKLEYKSISIIGNANNSNNNVNGASWITNISTKM